MNKNQIDFDLLVASEKVQKITAFITITDELLDDPAQMESKIRIVEVGNKMILIDIIINTLNIPIKHKCITKIYMILCIALCMVLCMLVWGGETRL